MLSATTAQVSEDLAEVRVAIDLPAAEIACTSTCPTYSLAPGPSEGSVRFDVPGTLPADQPFAVGTGQQFSIQGGLQRDANDNGVLDTSSSDGRTGVQLFGDATRADWLVAGLGGQMQLVDAAQAYRGSHAIAATVSSPLGGLRVKFQSGPSYALNQLDTLRFWVRSDTAMGLMVLAHLPNGSYPRVEIPVAAGPWTKIEIPLSAFGTMQSVVEYLLYSDTATTFYVDEIALLGSRDGQTSPERDEPQWGVNLFSHADWTSDGAFVDAMRVMRRWGPVDAPWQPPSFTLPFTEDGVPRQPAGTVTFLDGYTAGVYQVRYRGVGTVRLKYIGMRNATIRIVPGTLRREGLETVFDVRIPTVGVPIMLQIVQTSASNPVRELKLLAPGYRGAEVPTYRQEFLSRLGPFAALRLMDYTETNNSVASDWSLRRKPRDVIQTSSGNSDAAKGGVAWELLVEMANESGKTPWINIPHQATDQYVTELAKLWRDQLRPDSRLIVEFSNEIWNFLFTQARELNNADYYGTVAPRLVAIRNIFNQVWGEEADRVEIVLSGQAANFSHLERALKYFTDNNLSPSSIIGSLAIGLYAQSEANIVHSQLDAVMADMTDLTTERRQAEALRALADNYQLKMHAYEGGQHLTRNQVNSDALLEAAQVDPRMGQVVRELYDLWKEAGGDLFMHYTFTGVSVSTSRWGLLDSLADPGSVKWDAALAKLAKPGDVNLDGTANFADFDILRGNFGQQQLWWQQGDLDADRSIDGDDVRRWWDAIVPEQLTAAELAQVQAFAAQQSLLLSTGDLTLSIQGGPLSENAVGQAGTLTVSRSGPTQSAVVVALGSSRPGELRVPASVEIPAGVATVDVPLYTINDGRMDGNQRLVLTASSERLRAASLEATVVDVGIGEPEGAWTGATVFLDANDNGLLDAEEASTVTDGAGLFAFTDVSAGTYRLRVATPGTPRFSARYAYSASAPWPASSLVYTLASTAQALNAGETRSIDFAYQATRADGSVVGPQSVAITIVGANDSPVAAEVILASDEDSGPIETTIDAADVDDERSTLEFTLLDAPAEGTLALTAGGLLTFTPGTDFQHLQTGDSRELTARYRVADPGGATSEATIRITIAGVSDAPLVSLNEGLLLALQDDASIPASLLSATDADGDSLTYVVTLGPTDGYLYFTDAPETPITEFTPADLDAGRLGYRHTGSVSGNDQFDFTVEDGSGLSATGTFAIEVQAPPETTYASVVGRSLFYNGSHFDQGDPAANSADDGAMATDKQPLLPGQTSTFVNYTSYVQGINGLILDVANLPADSSLGLDDFEFSVGNQTAVEMFTAAADPTAIVVARGAGVAGSDRIRITWSDGAIRNTWLRVAIKATANTGLAQADVHFWGNAVGETGNSAADAMVDFRDATLVRRAQSVEAVAITSVYDLNRDGWVDHTDRQLAGLWRTTAGQELKRLQAPASEPAPPPSAASLPAIDLLMAALAVHGTSPHDGFQP